MLTRETLAPVVAVDTDTRRVTVRLCRWNDPRPVRDRPDAAEYREAYPPGSVDLAADVHVVDHHHGDLIGRADPATFIAGDDGPTVEMVLARTSAGNDALALIDAGVIRAVSMELEPLEAVTRDGVVWRTRNRVHGVALAFRPAHDAPILATRDQVNGVQPMTDTLTETPPAPPEPAAVSVAVLERSIGELRDDLTRTFIAERAIMPDDPFAGLRFRSIGEYAEAVWNDPSNPILRRALADQITVNNPGVVPPGWVQTVHGIVDRGNPTIMAFGRDPLPDSGMDINWPYFDGDLLALVGVQAAEKTPITSVRVDLKKGTEDIVTYAGGSDISYQLIRRSSPSYMATYLRIMTAAYAAVTNNAAGDAAVAAAVPSTAVWVPATGTLEELATALFTASAEVQTATGAPATFALAASDVFMAAGGLAVVAARPYGTNNVAGTSDASTLRVEVAGLTIIHDPMLPAGTLLVSNSDAASWHAEGPFTVTAEDVEKLGQNVAVWGMGAFAAYLPNGIRSIGDGIVTTRRGGKSE